MLPPPERPRATRGSLTPLLIRTLTIIRQSIEAVEAHLDERAQGWALYEEAFDARLEGRASFWEA
jgi:hypothetical protein